MTTAPASSAPTSAPMKVTTGIKLLRRVCRSRMRDSEMPLARAVRTKSASMVSSIDVLVSRATYAMDSDASTNPGIETRSVVVTRTRLS
ncbi:Uncharacterised protein [Mycobacteroides abscessus subsp. abscessus]|nr:Uncharacterised protein [Mycobacteroides abscessus subsp. abscessus]